LISTLHVRIIATVYFSKNTTKGRTLQIIIFRRKAEDDALCLSMALSRFCHDLNFDLQLRGIAMTKQAFRNLTFENMVARGLRAAIFDFKQVVAELK
jgi:hypothetical protein